MEYDKIKQLMEDMGNSKLTSIDIDFADGTKIKMTKQNNQTTKDNYFVEKNNNNQEKIENLLLTRKKKSCKIIADVRNDAIRIWKAMALTGQKDSLSCRRFFIFHSIRIIQ